MKINSIILLLLLFNQTAFSQRTPEEYFKLGEECDYSDDSTINVAIEYYTKAIELDPDCFQCYERRAWRKSYLNDESAVLDYNKALELNHNCYKCYNGLASYQSRVENNFILARHYYYSALNVLKCETEQDFIEQGFIIRSIGQTYIEEYRDNNLDMGLQKSYQVQTGIWDSLIRTAPLLQYYASRAEIKLHELEDYKSALSDLIYVYGKSGYLDSHIIWDIAMCYENIGNQFQAIQYYTKAIEKRPKEYKNHPSSDNLDELYMNRGNCKMGLNDYRGALEDYNKALSVYRKSSSPSISDLYNCIGSAKIALKDFQGAIINLNKALELNKDNTYSIQNGQVEEINPTLAMTFYLRGIAEIYLKNKDRACNDWSKAGELGHYKAYDRINEYCK